MIYSAGVANPMPIICEEAENVQNMMNVNCLSFLMLGKEFFNRKNSKKDQLLLQFLLWRLNIRQKDKVFMRHRKQH